MLIWALSHPSRLPTSPPGIFFFFFKPLLLSRSAAFRNTEVERQDGDARFLHSEVPPSLPPFSLPHLQGGFFPLPSLYMRHLLALRSIWCSVKVNSWHLIPTSCCFISCLFRQSQNPRVAQMSRQCSSGRSGQTPVRISSDLNVSILSSWNSCWWMAATPAHPKQWRRCCRRVIVNMRPWVETKTTASASKHAKLVAAP